MPSDTGRAGGKKVGQQMDHHIIEDSPFIVACENYSPKTSGSHGWIAFQPLIPPHHQSDPRGQNQSYPMIQALKT